MSISIQNDFLTNVNNYFDKRMQENHPLFKEEDREEFMRRSEILRDAGIDSYIWSPNSPHRFFVQFTDVPMGANHEEWLENLSRKYVEFCDEAANNFSDESDEYYMQMEALNRAFESALKNTTLMPIFSYKAPEAKLVTFTPEQAKEQMQFEAEMARINQEIDEYNKNVQDIRLNFQNNMLRHVNTFYENFIHSIQTNSFETAFKESMELLNNSETTSSDEISYSDMMKIKDMISNNPVEYDEDGFPTKYRHKTAEDSYRALLKDDSIPYYVQKYISELFNYSIPERY